MPSSQLQLYNGALLLLGERQISSLTENVPSRLAMDQVWSNGIVDYILSQGQWVFAIRTEQLSPSPSVQPPFGPQYAYEIPSDYIRAVSISSDPYFNLPLELYNVEAGWWYSDATPIYVQYISNDTAYGGSVSNWSPDCVLYVQAYMAWQACERLTQSASKKAELEKVMKSRLVDAKSLSAMEKPTSFTPPGTWRMSRYGRFGTGRYGWRGGSSV